MIRRRGATALLLCASLLLDGCSFIFVRGPRKDVVPGRYERGGCTTSRLAPWFDTGVAAAQGYAVVHVLGQSDAQYASAPLSREQELWLLIGTTMLHGVSAMYGFSTVARCREVAAPPINPYEPAPVRQTRAQRRADEAAEEAAVEAAAAAKAEADREKAAADAKAAGEAAAKAR